MKNKKISVAGINSAICYDHFINSISETFKYENPKDLFEAGYLTKLSNNIVDDNILWHTMMYNIALLYPLLVDGYANNNFSISSKINSFFLKYDENYQSCSNMKKSPKVLGPFRNALEHGTYELCFENNVPYIKYSYMKNDTREVIFKKVELNHVLLLIEDMIKKSFNNSKNQRTAAAIINNMKIIYQYINFGVESNFSVLNGDFIECSDSVIHDMKIASSFASFYALYQKNLEQHFGPNYYALKNDLKAGKSIVGLINKGSYLDFSKLTNCDICSGNFVCYDINLIKMIQEEAQQINFKSFLNDACSLRFNLGLLSSYFNKMSETYQLNKFATKNGRINFNMIHHIRNAFAHGNVFIGDSNTVVVRDIFPGDFSKNILHVDYMPPGTITFSKDIPFNDFRSLIFGDNASIINMFAYENNQPVSKAF